MSVTEKISVAMGREELRLAKTAARQAGVSLSAYVTGAVREKLLDERRREAALEVLASFQAEDLPGAERQRELLDLWSSPGRGIESPPAARGKRPKARREAASARKRS